ncbi:hypothetical protein CHKEEEPN_1626 [Methylorubrum podarium]|nr:hypothetical protein CHKEEEPN_1626 [Methylorubrum podarium]
MFESLPDLDHRPMRFSAMAAPMPTATALLPPTPAARDAARIAASIVAEASAVTLTVPLAPVVTRRLSPAWARVLVVMTLRA